MIDTGFCVYLHRFKNGTIYIGKGRKRRSTQLIKSRRNIYWGRLFDKYGEPRVKVLVSGLSEDDALNIEREFMNLALSKGKKNCNITHSDNNPVISEESRLKMSQSRSGELSPTWGMVHSEEAKAKVSKANKGRFVGKKSPRYNHEKRNLVHKSGETARLTRYELCKLHGVSPSFASMLFSGKKASAKGWRLSETPEELTGIKGKRHGRYDHTIFRFIHKDGTTEECTKNELCTKYNLIHASNISYVCNGKLKSYKGWMIKGE